MLHTQTILETFLSNDMHLQVTWIQSGTTEIWRGKATPEHALACAHVVTRAWTHTHTHRHDSFGYSAVACSYLSLLGVWTESCPLVEACGFMSKDVLEGAEEEPHVVDRSRLLGLLPGVSSAV